MQSLIHFHVCVLTRVGTNVENVNYRVTKESLMERLNTDMRAASVSISKECRYGNYFRHYDPRVYTPN